MQFNKHNGPLCEIQHLLVLYRQPTRPFDYTPLTQFIIMNHCDNLSLDYGAQHTIDANQSCQERNQRKAGRKEIPSRYGYNIRATHDESPITRTTWKRRTYCLVVDWLVFGDRFCQATNMKRNGIVMTAVAIKIG